MSDSNAILQAIQVLKAQGVLPNLNRAQNGVLPSLVSGAGIGGTPAIARAALIALAEANGLTPGAIYITTDGMCCAAITNRLLQPWGAWYVNNAQVTLGSATTEQEMAYCFLPPLGPNARVEVECHAYMGNSATASRRMRIALSGSLGNLTGASDIYNRSNTTIKDTKARHSFSNSGNPGIQVARGAGESSGQAESGSVSNLAGVLTPTSLGIAVDTNVSQLLRMLLTGAKESGAEIITVASAVGNGTTVTVTESAAHNRATGNYIQISGANEAAFNKDPVQITVLSTTTYSYPAAGASGAATGTIQRTAYADVRKLGFAVFIAQAL